VPSGLAPDTLEPPLDAAPDRRPPTATQRLAAACRSIRFKNFNFSERDEKLNSLNDLNELNECLNAG
jgi:hypothetical protein